MYPQSRPYSAEEFAAKTRWAAEMIGRLDADVIAFQEVWSREALEAVLAEAGVDPSYRTRLHHRGRLGRGGGGLRGAGALGDPGGRRGTRRSRAAMRLVKRKQSMAQIRSAPPAADASDRPRARPDVRAEPGGRGRAGGDRRVLALGAAGDGRARAGAGGAGDRGVRHPPEVEAGDAARRPRVPRPRGAAARGGARHRALDDPADRRGGGAQDHRRRRDARRRPAGAGARRLQRRHLLGRAGGALGAAELPGGGDEHGGGAQRRRALHRGAAAAAALARRRLLHPRVPQRARGDRPRAGQRAVLRLVGTGGSGRSRRCASSTTTCRPSDRRRSDHGQVVARFDWEPAAAVSG